eukprot:5657438-Pyramimonas_sp.AAC.1
MSPNKWSTSGNSRWRKLCCNTPFSHRKINWKVKSLSKRCRHSSSNAKKILAITSLPLKPRGGGRGGGGALRPRTAT